MTLTYGAALAWLDGFVNFERRSGPTYSADIYRLDRFRRLLADLGDPQDRVPTVIVAGTKGKGSTAALIAAATRAAGVYTGFYSSPHLHTFRERIRLNGALITEEALAALVETRLRPAVEALQALGDPALEPTYFELVTALGFLTFAGAEVDLAVLEVGMGGRLDPTNVVTPVLSVITPISYDHMAVLGDTLAQIAFEKAGIIKPGGLALSAPQPPEAAAVIARVAAERGATLYQPADLLRLDPASLAVQRDAAGLPVGRTLVFMPSTRPPVPAPLPLLGRHQAGNAHLAAAALVLLYRHGPDALRRLPPAALVRALTTGFATVDWPGRLEILARAPLMVLDGAHNGESAQRLREALDEDFGVAGREVVFVMGVNRGHSVGDIVRELAPSAAHAVLTPLRNPRSTPPAELAAVWAPYGVPTTEAASVPDALQAAARLAATLPARLVCVTGSLYLVGEAREAFGRSYGTDPV